MTSSPDFSTREQVLDEELGGLPGSAVTIMFSLQTVMRELVRRGALPRFGGRR